jgi:hypothetical protein
MAGVQARGHLVGLVFGAMAAQVVFTAARLRLADVFGESDLAGAEVAEIVGTDETALHDVPQ